MDFQTYLNKEIQMERSFNSKDRMDYHHTCHDCGSPYKGFQFQTICWGCMRIQIPIICKQLAKEKANNETNY